MRDLAAHLALRLCERLGALGCLKLNIPVRIGGARVIYPLGGHPHLSHVGVHEPHLLGAMRAALQGTDGAVLDVGANIGQTLLKFIALRDDRPYVAFEPSLACAWQVRRVAEANGVEVTVLPVALSDRQGLVPFHSTDEPFDVYSTLEPTVRPEGFFPRKSHVPALRGDDVVAAMGLRVALLKIDVEGAEARVLAGLERTVARDRPAVICELLTEIAGDTARVAHSQMTAAWLKRMGYRGSRVAGREHLFRAA